jgi:Domain of unknown function (DUF4383)
MIRTLGLVMGSAFLIGGILGFVPSVAPDGMYFGIFMVNPAHNVLHIASGASCLIASMLRANLARLWFQIFGAFYSSLAAIGFVVREGMILGIISNNAYDAWGHAALALAMLLIGFFLPRTTRAA